MWEAVQARLALLELWSTRRLPRRRGQREVWEWLAELSWTRTGTRRGELRLDPAHVGHVERLLGEVWPGWEAASNALVVAALPPTPKGWSALEDQRRAETVGDVPERLNQRTAVAQVAGHSKATLTPARRAALGEVEVTRDGSVRLRPPAGLMVRRGALSLHGEHVAAVLGEVAITDRAFRDGVELEGPIRALWLVENLGAFQDVVAPDGWLVAHVAGWDTATVARLLRKLARVPAVHFGDLDPNGLRIFRHLREIRPDLRWLVPEFWAEWMPERAQAGAWPETLDLEGVPPLVRRLAAGGWWLEQEAIVLDPRLEAAAEGMLEGNGGH